MFTWNYGKLITNKPFKVSKRRFFSYYIYGLKNRLFQNTGKMNFSYMNKHSNIRLDNNSFKVLKKLRSSKFLQLRFRPLSSLNLSTKNFNNSYFLKTALETKLTYLPKTVNLNFKYY